MLRQVHLLRHSPRRVAPCQHRCSEWNADFMLCTIVIVSLRSRGVRRTAGRNGGNRPDRFVRGMRRRVVSRGCASGDSPVVGGYVKVCRLLPRLAHRLHTAYRPKHRGTLSARVALSHMRGDARDRNIPRIPMNQVFRRVPELSFRVALLLAWCSTF